jgi:uncharacterized protein
MIVDTHSNQKNAVILVKILSKYESRLEEFFKRNVTEEGHGLSHAMSVLIHAISAVNCYGGYIDEFSISAVLLAALLHDVDDHKLFNTVDYENARELLKDETPAKRDLVIKMIKLVSCSTNGNNVNPEDPVWMYFPRWADRLEAIGYEGIKRCYLYSVHVGRPLFTEETGRATTLHELEKIAPKSRFIDYIEKKGAVGVSSMIDHFYDKLIHLKVETGNEYLDEMFKRRMGEIYEFLFEFGATGEVKNIC